MNYPTLEQVKVCEDRRQLGEWLRHLPIATSETDLAIVNLVYDKFYANDQNWTPELSKQVGWDPR